MTDGQSFLQWFSWESSLLGKSSLYFIHVWMSLDYHPYILWVIYIHRDVLASFIFSHSECLQSFKVWKCHSSVYAPLENLSGNENTDQTSGTDTENHLSWIAHFLSQRTLLFNSILSCVPKDYMHKVCPLFLPQVSLSIQSKRHSVVAMLIYTTLLLGMYTVTIYPSSRCDLDMPHLSWYSFWWLMFYAYSQTFLLSRVQF